MLISSAYSCDQFRTMEKRKGSPISIKLNIIRQGMMSKENLWIINLLPIKHLSLLINPWEKLWSYLQHACLVTWPPTLCCGTVQKEAPDTTGMHTLSTTELDSSIQRTKQRLREEPQPDHHEDRTRCRCHHCAGPWMDIRGCPRWGKVHLPGPLGFRLSSEQKQTSKSTCCFRGLSPLWFSVWHTPFSSRRTDWLSHWRPSRGFRSCQQAPPRWEHRAPDSGPAPCPNAATPCSRRSLWASASRGAPPRPSPDWVSAGASGSPSDKIVRVHVGWTAVSAVFLVPVAVPLDLCEICAFAACAGC